MHCYPTNNYVNTVDSWSLMTMAPGQAFYRKELDGKVMILFLNENQGCCFWYTVFDRFNPIADPPVYVSGGYFDGDEEVQEDEGYDWGFNLENPSFSSFWELQAKDGLEWYKQHPDYRREIEVSGE